MTASRNPWRLSPGEQRCLDGLSAFGDFAIAGRELGLSPYTVKEMCYRARKKMKANSNVQAAVLLARWLWTQQAREAA